LIIIFTEVPYYLVRQEILVKKSEKLIEVFCNNERVASHIRSSEKYKHSTTEAHLPPHHLAVKSWTLENFITWSATIGPYTEQFTKLLIVNRTGIKNEPIGQFWGCSV
jgi:hypothetical protein